MKTWYQVWINYKVFGFCVTNNHLGVPYIYDHPEYKWKAELLETYKKELINQRAIVAKIGEICKKD